MIQTHLHIFHQRKWFCSLRNGCFILSGRVNGLSDILLTSHGVCFYHRFKEVSILKDHPSVSSLGGEQSHSSYILGATSTSSLFGRRSGRHFLEDLYIPSRSDKCHSPEKCDLKVVKKRPGYRESCHGFLGISGISCLY